MLDGIDPVATLDIAAHETDETGTLRRGRDIASHIACACEPSFARRQL